MNKKIRKLQSAVKDDGYIYIFYHMAKNEKDISNFCKNRYFRKDEMVKIEDIINVQINMVPVSIKIKFVNIILSLNPDYSFINSIDLIEKK